MTNYEKYRESIDLILQQKENIALNKDTKEIVSCPELDCKDCLFSYRYNKHHNCTFNKTKWLFEEYVKPAVNWSKVPVDTPVLVSDDGVNWKRRYFAKVNNTGEIFVFSCGATNWSSDGRVVWYRYAKLAEVE